MKTSSNASRRVAGLISEVSVAKIKADLSSEDHNEWIADHLFAKAENLVIDIYKGSADAFDMRHEFAMTQRKADRRGNQNKLEMLLYFLQSVDEDLKTKEEFNNIAIPVSAAKLQSLTEKLTIEEIKTTRLEELRAIALADLRKMYCQSVKQHKAAYIGVLVILFQAAVIFQLILDRTHWPATTMLAGILCCLALAIAYEDGVKNLLRLTSWTHEFPKAIFAITGAAIAVYCAFLLMWS